MSLVPVAHTTSHDVQPLRDTQKRLLFSCQITSSQLWRVNCAQLAAALDDSPTADPIDSAAFPSTDRTTATRTAPEDRLLVSTASLTGHVGPVWSSDWHWTGRHVVTGGHDGTVRLWQLDGPMATASVAMATRGGGGGELTDSSGQLAVGQSACVVGQNEGNLCRSVLRGRRAESRSPGSGSVNSVHFLPYSNIVSGGSSDGNVYIWDARTVRTGCIKPDRLDNTPKLAGSLIHAAHGNEVKSSFFFEYMIMLMQIDVDGGFCCTEITGFLSIGLRNRARQCLSTQKPVAMASEIDWV
ncbi:unnamed protein product [Protopolystoma xenopodis]|uniref:Uncharacterized protein n=1 Tax=Protopolystoma xenopodis TaxID=117903 RepID=A0A448WWI5_9PLAT|nr:unnamed protein product [Protopolystoma xenopodis]